MYKNLYIPFFIVTLVFVSLFYFSVAMDIRYLLRHTGDDAAYFFKIAENVSKGRGFTFDGINKTNGFQPLWLYTLMPLFTFFHYSPEVMYRICMSLQAVLLLLSAAILLKMLSHYFSTLALFLFSILFSSLMIAYYNGMESGTVVFSLSLLLHYGWKKRIDLLPDIKNCFFFGILLGISFLSRLDLVFLGFSICSLMFLRYISNKQDRKSQFFALLSVIAGSTLITMPYLLYNIGNFGHAVPISGKLKTCFPTLCLNSNTLNWVWFYNLDIFTSFIILQSGILIFLLRKKNSLRKRLTLAFFSLLFLGCLGIFYFIFQNYFAFSYDIFFSQVKTMTNMLNFIDLPRYIATSSKNIINIVIIAILIYWLAVHVRSPFKRPNYLYFSLICLSFSIVLHTFFTTLFMKWGVFWWHFITYPLLKAIAIGLVIDDLVRKKKYAAYIPIGIICMLEMFMLFNNMNKLFRPLDKPITNWHIASYDAAIWARNNIEKSDVIAMKDAGNFGFFSMRNIINLDGVVNNYEYQLVLKNHSLNKYLKKNGVKYLVRHTTFDLPDVTDGKYNKVNLTFVSQLYNERSEEVVLYRNDEVYRSELYYNRGYPGVFLIWKYK